MTQETKKAGLIARIVAVALALAVIGGSIFFIFAPGRNGNTGALPIAAANAEGFRTLKKGDSGKEVKVAQEALKQLGYYSGKVDSNFSKALEAAVMDFQKDFGLKATGQLDEETYVLLAEEVGAELPADPAAAKPDATAPPAEEKTEEEPFVVQDGEYSDKEHVAAYLREFGRLPSNYITKKEAQALGWVSTLGNLWEVAPGKSIGGDRFGNYEGQLPTAKGRKYTECDIDYSGGIRNAKRIIFSNDGLIFYTEDHYTTFEEIE